MIKGTRIPVYIIMELFASGYTIEKVIEAYPALTKEDVGEALNYTV